MIKHPTSDGKPLPSNFVYYDHRNPSPHFTRQQLDYIESINKDFNEADLARIRGIERFMLNLNVMGMAEGAIPGLRHKPGIDCVYVRRFSSDTCDKLMSKVLRPCPEWFPQDEDFKCNMPPFRLTVPNGDRYYPFVFHGDLDSWRKRLNESAVRLGTLAGQFEKGTFIFSNGERFNFAAIKVDSLEKGPWPKEW